MRELLDPKDEKQTVESATRHREIILPSNELSTEKNVQILRYNLQILDERLRKLEVDR